VRKVLLDLKLAIEGTIIMSPHLLQAMDAMYDARVPEMWKGISWESSTLGFWFTEFLERNTQFTRWIFQVLILTWFIFHFNVLIAFDNIPGQAESFLDSRIF
jgi:hypothetical protein